MPLVEIGAFADRGVAEMARGLLAANGIAAVLFDGGVASLGHLAPARLLVEEADRAVAERLLADHAA